MEKEKTENRYGYIDINNEVKKPNTLIFASLCLTSKGTFELQCAYKA